MRFSANTVAVIYEGAAPDLQRGQFSKSCPNEDMPTLEALWWADDMGSFVARVIHIGPYDAQGPILEDMHNRLIPENGLIMRGVQKV